MCGHHTGFIGRGFASPMGAVGERPQFDIKLPIWPPPMIFPRGYILKYFPQGDTSARQRGFGFRVFPLLGELSKTTKPHLPVCQLCHWKLGPTKWSSPTTKSLDPIVVTVLRVVFPGCCLEPATDKFVCNCPVPEAICIYSSVCCIDHCYDYLCTSPLSFEADGEFFFFFNTSVLIFKVVY